MDMPKDIIFMPEEKGGYGLTSMVDLVDRMRVDMYMQALNAIHAITYIINSQIGSVAGNVMLIVLDDAVLILQGRGPQWM